MLQHFNCQTSSSSSPVKFKFLRGWSRGYLLHQSLAFQLKLLLFSFQDRPKEGVDRWSVTSAPNE